MPALLAYVGYWSKTGKHLFGLNFTGFDRVEIPQGSSLLPYLGVLSFGWPGSANPESEQFRPVPRTCGRFRDILSLR